MQEKVLNPHAASLSQSMRDLGYSVETAVADLVDNSITAYASTIRILLDVTTLNDAALVILDDGCGMSEDQLLEAMRVGSRDPGEKRTPDDLGRFGLGLKTASFSQCRALTVVSRIGGESVAAQWDLDLINSRNEWIVRTFGPDEIADLPFVDQLGKQGTYVLWQKLDRLLESNTEERNRTDVLDKLSVVEKHLALVFHRYISGEFRKRKISIQINGHPVEAFDPYCTSNKATQLMPEEVVRINGEEVTIQPYILPHHSKLTKKEYDFYRTRSDFVSNQGAYVYRNGRLMVWGDWFRLVPKSEATKLARVRIDFTNALDQYWTIDIKKSRAQPPQPVRDKLRQIVDRISDQSRRVYIGRGERLFDGNKQPLWSRYRDRDNVRYTVSREHPLISSFKWKLDGNNKASFDLVLSLIERSLPVEAIYADYSSSPQSFDDTTEVDYQDLKAQVYALYELFSTNGINDLSSFSRVIYGLKPFSDHRTLTDTILEELFV